MAHLAGGDEPVDRAECVLQRRLRVGDVQQVVVHIVRLQAAQAGLDLLLHVGRPKTGAGVVGAGRVAAVRTAADGVAHLGRDVRPVPLPAQGLAQDRLGHPARRAQVAVVALVDVGGVEEVDAQVESGVHQVDGVRPGDGTAEEHGPQGDDRYSFRYAGQRSPLHDRPLH